MKSITARKLQKILRRFGLRPASCGSGDGHAVWIDPDGRTCRPVLRHHDVPWASLFALSQELQNKRICSREDFFQQVRIH